MRQTISKKRVIGTSLSTKTPPRQVFTVPTKSPKRLVFVRNYSQKEIKLTNQEVVSVYNTTYDTKVTSNISNKQVDKFLKSISTKQLLAIANVIYKECDTAILAVKKLIMFQ